MSRRLRQRRQLQLSIPEEEDRISALPDSLVHHILSFLPSKDAASTTILSKRWKPLWLLELIIHFNHQPFPETVTFSNFVDSLMANQNNTQPILSFHIKCHYYNCDIHKFVSNAIQRRVQNLTIDLSRSDFPTAFILRTETLSVLKLKRITLNYEGPVVDLPSLKLLHLESICFTYYGHIRKLLSGCPILQELEANDLTIKIPCRVFLGSSQPTSLSNLVRANISNISPMHNLLDRLRNAQHMRLLAKYSYELHSVFHNLTHLELTLNFMPNYGMLKWSWLIKLLQNFPLLQTLIIDEVDTVHNFGVGGWTDPEIVPECLLSHLTTCSLRSYSRINCELQFAKYIMQNSRVLSIMKIQSAKFLDTNTKIQMSLELSSFPMNSTICQLLFI